MKFLTATALFTGLAAATPFGFGNFGYNYSPQNYGYGFPAAQSSHAPAAPAAPTTTTAAAPPPASPKPVATTTTTTTAAAPPVAPKPYTTTVTVYSTVYTTSTVIATSTTTKTATSTSTVTTTATTTSTSVSISTSVVLSNSTTTTTVTATETAYVTSPYSYTANTTCLTNTTATNLVNIFASLLTAYNNDTANTYLASDFTDTSDSINWLAGYPLGGYTFSSKAAFEAGQGSQPAIGFSVLGIDAIGCTTAAFRWEAILGSSSPVKGINMMYASNLNGTDQGWQIAKMYSEFNSALWDVEVGGSCTPPS